MIKQSKGITLIALVITIIILLILAGLSISALTGSGLFGKAQDATNKSNQAKARETLELVLEEAFIQKYDEGLTEEQLDKKIQEIGELIEKENPNPNIQNVIVEGYIFKIDKSVPKIIDYVAPADGIIITAVLSNNATDGWLSADESDVNIKGKIITYSGGKITEVIAKSGEKSIEILIDKDGKYEINHITESSTITIEAKDSKGKINKKEIKVEVKIDKTDPTIETVKAEIEGSKIKLSATGHDKAQNGEEQSGIKEFNYTITPADGIDKASGTFGKNEVAEITITNWTIYTIRLIATDKCGNTTEEANAKEQTIDMRDTTPPEIETVEAKASKYTIKIKAIAKDSQSGLASLKYSITPTTGLPSGKNEGDLPQNGQEVAITSTAIATYTVTITATDNAGNPATKTMSGIETSDAMSVEDAKSLVTSISELQKHMGEKVAYKTGETWQIFYYDDTGEFGPAETLYLKRALPAQNIGYTLSTKTAETDPAVQMMRRMNPKWAQSSYNSIDMPNEQVCVWLCDPSVWNSHRNAAYSSYAIGGPSVEMYVNAYNVYKTGIKDAKNLICEMDSIRGYKFGANGKFVSYNEETSNGSIESGLNGLFVSSNLGYCRLCSPHTARW